jgi:hypothetical protein
LEGLSRFTGFQLDLSPPRFAERWVIWTLFSAAQHQFVAVNHLASSLGRKMGNEAVNYLSAIHRRMRPAIAS